MEHRSDNPWRDPVSSGGRGDPMSDPATVEELKAKIDAGTATPEERAQYAVFNAVQNRAADDERRKSERVPVVLTVKFAAVEEPKAEDDGATFNVSMGGLGLFADRTYEVGEELEVLVAHPRTGEFNALRGRVKWNKPGESMGIEFVDLEPDQVHALSQLVLSLSPGPDLSRV